ncbi:MAG TPA: hypothetical protein VKP69_28085, partial [Isosphaeraceae bacterium]|nr:hypothetical protein [Isosphaeraceae bacterium]
MITFSPPAGFNDVSEYTFAGDERRVLVRHTTGVGSAGDLVRIGQEFATQLKDLFEAPRVDVSEVKTREDGTAYITVTATMDGS